MNDMQCQHALIAHLMVHHAARGLEINRCKQHSRGDAGVGVWVWSAGKEAWHECLCMVADRFLVAAEGTAPRWRQIADVVTGFPRATAGCAVAVAEAQLADAPGCALVTVPAHGFGTVFRTRAERVLVHHEPERVPVCGVCVHPWLAAGYRLAQLVEPLRFAVRAPSRG
ncbi:hypothetical protein [Streptomyces iranensis]|uniref:hypothetical protein n=1 Tax=Streptomyces iranensis TaxID=576784 RepID=UPI0039B76DA1